MIDKTGKVAWLKIESNYRERPTNAGNSCRARCLSEVRRSSASPTLKGDVLVSKPKFIPLTGYQEYPPDEMKQRAISFYEQMRRRRTVRQFSDRPVDRKIIEQCVLAAATAPSGANLQPWHFVVVSDPSVKRQIRIAAEEEEKEFYTRRAPKEWLAALAPLGTDEHKEFLETAPYLIAIFVERYGKLPTGEPVKHYYPKESVGLASGLLINGHSPGGPGLAHAYAQPHEVFERDPWKTRERVSFSLVGRRLSMPQTQLCLTSSGKTLKTCVRLCRRGGTESRVCASSDSGNVYRHECHGVVAEDVDDLHGDGVAAGLGVGVGAVVNSRSRFWRVRKLCHSFSKM